MPNKIGILNLGVKTPNRYQLYRLNDNSSLRNPLRGTPLRAYINVLANKGGRILGDNFVMETSTPSNLGGLAAGYVNTKWGRVFLLSDGNIGKRGQDKAAATAAFAYLSHRRLALPKSGQSQKELIKESLAWAERNVMIQSLYTGFDNMEAALIVAEVDYFAKEIRIIEFGDHKFFGVCGEQKAYSWQKYDRSDLLSPGRLGTSIEKIRDKLRKWEEKRKLSSDIFLTTIPMGKEDKSRAKKSRLLMASREIWRSVSVDDIFTTLSLESPSPTNISSAVIERTSNTNNSDYSSILLYFDRDLNFDKLHTEPLFG